jgi:hypothetical protein
MRNKKVSVEKYQKYFEQNDDDDLDLDAVDSFKTEEVPMVTRQV